jgi:hypothetical protein
MKEDNLQKLIHSFCVDQDNKLAATFLVGVFVASTPLPCLFEE